MRKMVCLFLAALACLLMAVPTMAFAADFSAAGLSVSGTAQQLGKPASYGSKDVVVSVPGENPVLDGVNPITGESYSGPYRVVLANIDTHPKALPHWGVSSADLIYELPIQADGSTRSLAVFMSDFPSSAGPIRSARVPMASLREMWGGTYCFYGYQGGRDTNNVQDWVKKYSAEKRFAYPYYLNGITKNSSWFPRSSDQNHVAPYNVRLDMSAVVQDYSLTPTPHPFLFGEGLDRGEEVGGIIISYKSTSPAYVTAYQYNPATGLYDRYRNGAPYVDANNGQACAYANVIVLRTDVGWASGNPSRPVIRLNGQGVCEIFQNGKYIRGTWVRDCTETKNLDRRMVFLDENGEELVMKTGKTFIQIVDNDQPVVVLSDSAIAGAVEPQEQRLTIGQAIKVKVNPTRTPKPTRTPEPTETPEPEEEPTEEPTEQPTEKPAEPEEKPTEPEQKPEEKPAEPEQKPEEQPAASAPQEDAPQSGGEQGGE